MEEGIGARTYNCSYDGSSHVQRECNCAIHCRWSRVTISWVGTAMCSLVFCDIYTVMGVRLGEVEQRWTGREREVYADGRCSFSSMQTSNPPTHGWKNTHVEFEIGCVSIDEHALSYPQLPSRLSNPIQSPRPRVYPSIHVQRPSPCPTLPSPFSLPSK